MGSSHSPEITPPSPDLGLPALLPSQGGELWDRRANKPQSTSLAPRTDRCPQIPERGGSRASPGPRPRQAQARAREL